MRKNILPRNVFILLAIALGLALVGGTIAFAQYQARVLTEIPAQGEMEAEAAMALMEVPVSYVDGITPGLPPDDNPVIEGTANPEGADATFKYYMVSGATLRGRTSTATYTYYGTGCVYSTDPDSFDRLLNTELHIPDNSTIKYLRLYYIDTSATNRPMGFITFYQPGQSASDLIAINDSAMNGWAAGFGFTVSEEVTHTVNNTVNAYTLVGWPSAADANVKICGMRVAYYEPVVYRVSMPIIRK